MVNVLNNAHVAIYSSVVISISVIATMYYINQQRNKRQCSLQTMGYSIAHDVGEPLSLGIMSAEIAEQELDNKNYEVAKKYLAEMKEGQKRAINDMQVVLSAMSSDASKKPTDWGEYSMSKSVLDTLGNYYMSKEQRARVSFKCDKDFTFTGSLTMVRLIVNNLLMNAFKYAGEYVKIEVFINNNDRTLHIKDNGFGMDEEIKEQIFKKYATTRGYGIGLSFCKEAMDLIEGEIECISDKDKGTEFIMSFPQ
jgi:two-component system phosphate regulon sensor histidine kinase PhoR